jgi:hypothetical protein
VFFADVKAKNLLLYAEYQEISWCPHKNTEKTIFPYYKHNTTLKNIQEENQRQRICGVTSAGVGKTYEFQRWIKIMAIAV